MEKKHYELNVKATELQNQLKDAICEQMKELGYIKFNFRRINTPFMNSEGDFKSVDVERLMYDTEYFGDVIAIDEYGNEWSVQEEGTLNGCLELLYYLEEEAYVKL